MRLAFDARTWERRQHSFQRVLSLLVDAARVSGWKMELWIDDKLRPEFAGSGLEVRAGRESRESSDADILWSPAMESYDTRAPTIITVHDVNPLLGEGRNALERAWRRARFRARAGRAVARAWKTVTDTGDARRRIEAEFPGAAGRLAVVPLYAGKPFLPVAGAGLSAGLDRMGLKPGYLLFVGSLRRHKNWAGLIKAYAGLPASVRDAHPLVLAGPAHRGGHGAARLAAALNVAGRVRVPGTVRDELLPALYSGALMFVFPSFMEGFGLPALEAMACGTPVISSDRTSLPEVLGDAPLYADPADIGALTSAMERVAADKCLRSEMIGKGLARAASFGPERTARAMESATAGLHAGRVI